jgi:L-ascorbate metabolism protein UlaG (beta-lactamase superfamily)
MMDIQFYGANCLAFTFKSKRVVVDDNLADIGAKGIIKAEDVALFTTAHGAPVPAKLVLDGPGEFEVSDISIVGITARAHIDEQNEKHATMFKLSMADVRVLVTGHIYPDLSESQLEAIGLVDVLVVPVGGNGYTLDPAGSLKLIKAIEPKLVIPTHYADPELKFPVPQQELEHALKEIGMEAKLTTTKLHIKANELMDSTQLVILEKA